MRAKSGSAKDTAPSGEFKSKVCLAGAKRCVSYQNPKNFYTKVAKSAKKLTTSNSFFADLATFV